MSSDVQTYSIRPRIFLIRPHHTIDDEMLDRYIGRYLIPAFDMFPEMNLADADVDRLMMSKEVADLPMDLFDAVEQALNVLSEVVGVDWVIVPRPAKRELFVAQIDHYEHIRYQAHLHVKHYIRFKNAFTIPYADIDDVLLRVMGSQTNLSELPFDVYKIIQKHKPEEQPDYPETSIADADYEDLSYLDEAEIPDDTTDELLMPDTPKPPVPAPEPIVQKRVVDNQIITPDSLSSIQRHTDELSNPKRLHASIMEMQDYLRTNMIEIMEFHNPESDLAFRGKWHDGAAVSIFAFNLTDKRENSAWLIKIKRTEAV